MESPLEVESVTESPLEGESVMESSLEEQLRQARKRLAETEEEYREFAYTVSHDLSAPLRSIEGFATIIAEDHAEELSERSLRYLNTVIKSAGKGKAVLEQLLIYSRLNINAEPFRACDMNVCLRHALADLEELVDQTNARVDIESLPHVVADAVQLRQAFYQLLKNALVFHPLGSRPRIEVSFCEEGDHVQVAFRDNGIGIPAKAADKIFKPCRRFVKERDFPGDGMGLAIVKKIARRHEGTIRFEQPSGPGVTFILSLSTRLNNEK